MKSDKWQFDEVPPPHAEETAEEKLRGDKSG